MKMQKLVVKNLTDNVLEKTKASIMSLKRFRPDLIRKTILIIILKVVAQIIHIFKNRGKKSVGKLVQAVCIGLIPITIILIHV